MELLAIAVITYIAVLIIGSTLMGKMLERTGYWYNDVCDICGHIYNDPPTQNDVGHDNVWPDCGREWKRWKKPRTLSRGWTCCWCKEMIHEKPGESNHYWLSDGTGPYHHACVMVAINRDTGGDQLHVI